MVKEFQVIVSSTSVIFHDAKGLINYHFTATVDGEKYHYIVKNEKLSSNMKKTAYSRASVAIHYHAKNAGNYVRFETGGSVFKNRKKKISPKQISMFGDMT